MSSSVVLSQETTSLPGVNLKWAYTGLSTIKEITLIYFKNTSDADIVSVDVPSGVIVSTSPQELCDITSHRAMYLARCTRISLKS
jgi:NAD(P)H-hydrate repair Nnr-like enzyme with NAD(P)H-hydrate epimerase domain